MWTGHAAQDFPTRMHSVESPQVNILAFPTRMHVTDPSQGLMIAVYKGTQEGRRGVGTDTFNQYE